MGVPRVFADFNDLLRWHDRVRVGPVGKRDVQRNGLILVEGMVVQLYDYDSDENDEPDDLISLGTIYWDAKADAWMARLDRDSIQNESEIGRRRRRR